MSNPAKICTELSRSIQICKFRIILTMLTVGLALLYLTLATSSAQADDPISLIEHLINANFNARAVYGADINQDGKIDLAATDIAGVTLNWWQNEGNGLWTKNIIPVSEDIDDLDSIYLTDVDGDLDMDIVGGGRLSDNLSWWKNSAGNGTNWLEQPIAAPGSFDEPQDVSAADLDGDGDSDVLAAAYSDDSLAWWENTDGSGTVWIKHTITTSFDGAASVAMADLDNDGDLDVIGAACLADEVSWWQNDGTPQNGGWSKRSISSGTVGCLNRVSIADLNGDGFKDVLSSALSGDIIEWWQNDGSPQNGGWLVRLIATGFNGAYRVAALDLDDDGDEDVVGVAIYANLLSWWENADGVGTTWTAYPLVSTFTGSDIYVADLEADGDVDIFGSQSDDLTWWEARPKMVEVKVVDSTGLTVTQLITNSEGWPTPNPLTATVTLRCPAGGPDCTTPLTMTIGSPDNARFFVFNRTETNKPVGLPSVLCTFPIVGSNTSYTSYTASCNDDGSTDVSVPAGQTRELHWSVWIQPSEALSLTFSADWGANGVDSQFVQIPRAKIRPIVFVPGYLGTYPSDFGPEFGGGGRIDPLLKVYDNLLEAFQRAGYEKGTAGSGATLIPFPYDWRLPLTDTGSLWLTAHIQNVRSDPNQRLYADHDKVDLVTHSTGGLIARAHLEDTVIANNDNVHTLLTLGTPHRGIPGTYRGWYGGDPSVIITRDRFVNLRAAIIYCENYFPITSEFGLIFNYNFPPQDFYDYFRSTAPSIQNFTPRADFVNPPYLIDNTKTFTYPYAPPLPAPQTPPSLFFDDLNTLGGRYDLTQLQGVPRIISSYSNYFATETQFEVGPPPNPIDPDRPEFWAYGTYVTTTVQGAGDSLVPDYSGNLTTIAPYPNIQAQLEPQPLAIDHLELVSMPYMIRQAIFYMTDINLTQYEKFWDISYTIPTDDQIQDVALKCSPTRILIVDPLGRRVGHDLQTGQVINEIPGAYITEDNLGPQFIFVPRIEGEYQLHGIGTGQGEYKAGVIRTVPNPMLLGALQGVTDIGQRFQLNYGLSAPQENGGQIVLEAEKFTANIGRSDRTWFTQTLLSGYSGSSYMNTLLDIDLQFTAPYTNSSPELSYAIDFNTIGTYYVWIRGYAPNAAGDSLHVSLDSQSGTILTGFVPQNWNWANNNQSGRVTIEVTEPGTHSLHLWQREDGLRVDRILLTTDSNYIPIGSGP